MRVICFECSRQIGEKAPFSDTEATHTLCEPCLRKTIQRLKDERRRKNRQYQAELTSMSRE